MDDLLPLVVTSDVPWNDILERQLERCDLLIAERVAEVIRAGFGGFTNSESLDTRLLGADRGCRRHLADRKLETENATVSKKKALEILPRDFVDPDGLGPSDVAQFQCNAPRRS